MNALDEVKKKIKPRRNDFFKFQISNQSRERKLRQQNESARRFKKKT